MAFVREYATVSTWLGRLRARVLWLGFCLVLMMMLCQQQRHLLINRLLGFSPRHIKPIICNRLISSDIARSDLEVLLNGERCVTIGTTGSTFSFYYDCDLTVIVDANGDVVEIVTYSSLRQ